MVTSPVRYFIADLVRKDAKMALGNVQTTRQLCQILHAYEVPLFPHTLPNPPAGSAKGLRGAEVFHLEQAPSLPLWALRCNLTGCK